MHTDDQGLPGEAGGQEAGEEGGVRQEGVEGEKAEVRDPPEAGELHGVHFGHVERREEEQVLQKHFRLDFIPVVIPFESICLANSFMEN